MSAPRPPRKLDTHRALHATTRRRFVSHAAASVTALAWFAGCGGAKNESVKDGAPNGSNGGSAGNGTGGTATGGSGGTSANACEVYPQQTAGPFYLDDDLVRQDITEDKPGTPLELALTVLGASDCAPLEGLAIDLWQCDADGVYSGFTGQLGNLDTTGQTFLRGTQLTDAEGRVTFHTIYPGWYPGRTTHLHFRVHTSDTSAATSQLYFPEATSAAIYATAPYDARGQKDTTNDADGVTGSNVPPLVDVTETSDGYAGSLTVHVVGA